ncbi:hypothetical protein CQA58_00750 [Helicobacter brantae]|uniref:Uncharacterized protein n=1 Tax=Helicobacter brantae TaxID=375927 RepID=A0A3D8J4M4_9HELI|nr:hypothetical protein CQA58_00750 [Helicobacter brantae]
MQSKLKRVKKIRLNKKKGGGVEKGVGNSQREVSQSPSISSSELKPLWIRVERYHRIFHLKSLDLKRGQDSIKHNPLEINDFGATLPQTLTSLHKLKILL